MRAGFGRRESERRTAPETVAAGRELGARCGGEEARDGRDVDDAARIEGRRILGEEFRQADRHQSEQLGSGLLV